MIIASTSFPHSEIHNFTWQSPDTFTLNQTDHIFVNRRHCTIVNDTRSYRGANVDTDHLFISSKVRNIICKIFYIKKEDPRFKPDIARMKDPITLEKDKIKISDNIRYRSRNQKSKL